MGHSGPLFTSAAAIIGVVLATTIIEIISRKLWKEFRKEMLHEILDKSAPVAASQELVSEKETATCERLLSGRQFIITANADIANYIFNGKNKGNFVRRPAEESGLKELGMFGRGLIWNNHLEIWHNVRGCFQKVLDESTLSRAAVIANDECRTILAESFAHAKEAEWKSLNMLELARKVTFRTTLNVFFGLHSKDFESSGIAEHGFIEAIVAYFKAWEFFLFRPRHDWIEPDLSHHRTSISILRKHVQILLAAAPTSESRKESKGLDRVPSNRSNRKEQPLFIDLLFQIYQQKGEHAQELLEQSALEMLLAGTDTSSVTAYYALLGISGDQGLQQELRSALDGAEPKRTVSVPALLKCVDETLRFKPVGPVVLREAVQADPKFPQVPLEEGAAVLVHLAEMNLREEYWQDPKKFNPKRFLEPPKSVRNGKVFFPFGDGPKGCIGMHLGRREVNTIIEAVVTQYELEVEGVETLTSLETHWDIANQPDKPALIRLRQLA